MSGRRIRVYEWLVYMRDDRRGFNRRYTVNAQSAVRAIDEARSLTIAAGYQPDQLGVTGLTRKREVT